MHNLWLDHLWHEYVSRHLHVRIKGMMAMDITWLDGGWLDDSVVYAFLGITWLCNNLLYGTRLVSI